MNINEYKFLVEMKGNVQTQFFRLCEEIHNAVKPIADQLEYLIKISDSKVINISNLSHNHALMSDVGIGGSTDCSVFIFGFEVVFDRGKRGPFRSLIKIPIPAEILGDTLYIGIRELTDFIEKSQGENPYDGFRVFDIKKIRSIIGR